MKKYTLDWSKITTIEDMNLVLNHLGGITVTMDEQFIRFKELESFLNEVPAEMEVLEDKEDINTVEE